MPIRYMHTNLIAKDWRRLAAFYCEVFGCVPVLPERNLSGEWLDRATGIDAAHLCGIHLKLPGYKNDGPTLEIFQYDAMPSRPVIRPDTPGFGHVAFAVEDVEAVANRVLHSGGTEVGELTEVILPGVGLLRFQYLADPEGNCIEIQRLTCPES